MAVAGERCTGAGGGERFKIATTERRRLGEILQVCERRVRTGGRSVTCSTRGDHPRSACRRQAAHEAQAQRVSDIQALRADAPAAPLNRMTLNIDGANGVKQQVTVDLRGNVVSTQINTDAATADRLRMRTADLQDALGRHGLESDTVKISGIKPADGVDRGHAVGAERDALKVGSTASSNAQDGANANGQRDRAPSRDWNQDESRREQASRARDQREQRDQQQDRRRPRPDFLFGNP
jgi:hypothetical protein